MIKIWFLGSFKVEINGTIIPIEQWKSKKAFVLFKYLSCQPNKKVPKDSIIELLWSECDPEMYTHNLHTTIYNLRRSLSAKENERSVICYSNGLYWFNAAHNCYIDIFKFNNLAKQAVELETLDPAAALKVYKQAINIYRGDFLEEDMYEDWTTSIRDTLRGQYIEMTTRAAQLWVQCHQNYREAIRICREALSYDDTVERLHQTVIRCYLAKGRNADAMVQYKACEKALMGGLGLSPSEETCRLVETIKNNDGKLKHINFSAGYVRMIDCNTLKQEIRARKTFVLLVLSFANKNYSEFCRTLELLQVSLRQGDLICRWTETSIAVLLATANYMGASEVSKRLEQLLLKWIPGCKLKFEIFDAGQSKQWLMKTAIDGSITQ